MPKTTLTKREMQITGYVAWGFLKKEIADELNISYNTVDNHVRNIYEKLNIGKETDLTRWYFFQKLDVRLVNPFRRIIAIFFLAITLAGILSQAANVRVLRAPNARTSRSMRTRGGRRGGRRNDYYLETA